MIEFRKLSIRRKLTAAMVGVTITALILMALFFLSYDVAAFRQNLVKTLSGLTDALGKNCTAALIFDNKEDAEKTLQALAFDPAVMTGCLYDDKGESFALYNRNAADHAAPTIPPLDYSPHMDGSFVTLLRPVIHDEKQIGTIFVKASLEGVQDHLRSMLMLSGISLLASLLISFMLSSAVQHYISRPILDLSDAARLITQRKDYSLRAAKHTEDEIGQLTDSFNQMLSDIETRDADLTNAYEDLQLQVKARFHAEEELKNLNEKLEQRVEERTKELKRSNEELEQFAYVASHDLQEPLRMVSSFMQLLERRYKGSLGNEADQWISFAVDGAKRMQSLIQDLLAFSRVGTQGKPMGPVDCEEVLKQVLSSLELSVKETGALITHDPMPQVMGDATQLSQLFQNLLANAMKFHGAQSPVIKITASKQKSLCKFSVKDKGIGIDPQFFDRIFVIFQRLHSRDEYQGTGIGLAVCRKIVERHRGSIWVESKPGHGTTFHFTIPPA